MQLIDPVVPINPPGTGKDFATVQARFALLGHQLAQTDSGLFIVSKWGMTRTFTDWGDVVRFLQAVGGKP